MRRSVALGIACALSLIPLQGYASCAYQSPTEQLWETLKDRVRAPYVFVGTLMSQTQDSSLRLPGKVRVLYPLKGLIFGTFSLKRGDPIEYLSPSANEMGNDTFLIYGSFNGDQFYPWYYGGICRGMIGAKLTFVGILMLPLVTLGLWYALFRLVWRYFKKIDGLLAYRIPLFLLLFIGAGIGAIVLYAVFIPLLLTPIALLL